MSREQSVEVLPEPRRKRHIFGGRTTFIVFLALVTLLLFFAFSGTTSITGNVIGNLPVVGTNKTIDTTGNFHIRLDIGELNNPIEVKQLLDDITIELLGGGHELHIGKDNIMDLSDLPTVSINMKNFDGTITFDANNILALKGTTSTLTVNGIPSSTQNGKIAVYLPEETPYTELSIEDIYLKRFDYTGSGTINIDDDRLALNLDNEDINLQGFVGNLETGNLENFGVKRKGLLLYGSAEEITTGNGFSLTS